MTSNKLFILNVLGSALYLGAYIFIPEILIKVLLFLLIILIFYTSDKIRQLNQNTYSLSRIFIGLSAITLVGQIFGQASNAFFYNLFWLVVILSIEFYELILKNN